MTQGIIYLNQGTKCIQRLLVSVFSLRKVYNGPITVFIIGEQPSWFLQQLKVFNCDTIELECKGIRPLVRKAMLWRDTPYDVTMFIDADTLIVDNIDEYFDKIKEYKFCTGEFAEWVTTGRTMRGRINSFASIVPDYVKPAIRYGKATNTGIFGFKKDAPILKEWEELTIKGQAVNRIPDEVACQMLLPRYRHWIAPVQWGVSVKMSQPHHYENMKIIHYHGRKHAGEWPVCALWKQAYCEMIATYPEQKKNFLQPLGDRRLGRYIQAMFTKDLTVVTAVNEKYLGKLVANYPKWMQTEGIMEYPMIVFVNGIDPKDERLCFLRNNVTVIPWDMKEYAHTRELMLTSFVLGAAKHVKTKWWMKLDGDTTPKPTKNPFGYKLIFPEESWVKDTLTGHRWGYTKPGSFLVTLEKWANAHPAFEGTTQVFPADEIPNIQAQKRYGHSRIASYICLQSTEFTRFCASLAGERLPVPSHDTYMWYVAKRLGKPILRCNFKKLFQP